MNTDGFYEGYFHKEALKAEHTGALIGAGLGGGTGLLSNYVASKLGLSSGSGLSYGLTGLGGAGLGGAGGYYGTKYIKENPNMVVGALAAIEESDQLKGLSKALRESKLVAPLRRQAGRAFRSVKQPIGYNLEDVPDNIEKGLKERGVTGTIGAILKGEPLYDTLSGRTEGITQSMRARQDLADMYFGLPHSGEHFEGDRENLRIKNPIVRKQLQEDMLESYMDPDSGMYGKDHNKYFGAESYLGGGLSVHGKYDVPAKGVKLSTRDTWDYSTPVGRSEQDAYSAGLKGSGKWTGKQKNLVVHYVRNILDKLVGMPPSFKHEFIAKYPEIAQAYLKHREGMQ